MRMLTGLAFGTVLGVAAHLAFGGTPALEAVVRYGTEPVGKLFLRLLFMLVIPLIVSALALGPQISATDAPFRVLESPLLGAPDGVYASGNVVTQIGARALRPAVVKKVVGSTTNTDFVSIAGIPEQALWIEGAPHILSLPNAPERLAANTLIWTQGNRTLRLEGAESLDEAVEIAESFQ